MDDKRLGAFKIAVKSILSLWLLMKFIAALITFISQSAVDLTFFNPAAEYAFYLLFFSSDVGWGVIWLIIFILFVIIISIGFPMSFMLLPDNRTMNIFGFIGYSLLMLADIISSVFLMFQDGIYLLSLVLSLLIALCLFCYGRWYLRKKPEADQIDVGKTGEDRDTTNA